MSCEFRIMDHNYTQDDTVGLSASSQDSGFPASNVANPIRSKVWRSSGSFEITSSNNKLDFADAAAGAEKTATLVAGTYTSTTLASHIALRMAAAGSNTYTVAYSTSTGKWSISTSGGALELRGSTGTNIANGIWSTIGFSAEDRTGSTSYTGSNIAIHTKERLIIDLRSAEAIDSVALIFDHLRGPQLTESAVVKVLGSATQYWAAPGVSTTLTLDQNTETYTHFYSSDQTYRYWAIEIEDPRNPNLYVELSKVVLANATTLDHGPEVGFKYSTDDLSRQSVNEYGHKYSDVYANRRAFDFNLKLLPVADVYTLADLFERLGNSKTVAIALDSNETIFDKDRFFIYGYLKGDLKISNVHFSYFDHSLSVEEAL